MLLNKSDKFSYKNKRISFSVPNKKVKQALNSTYGSNKTIVDGSKSEESKNIYQDGDNSSFVSEEKHLDPDTSSNNNSKFSKINDCHSNGVSLSQKSKCSSLITPRLSDNERDSSEKQKSNVKVIKKDLELSKENTNKEILSKISEYEEEKLDIDYKKLNTQI